MITIPAKAYSEYWPNLCSLFSKFGGHKHPGTGGRVVWIIRASLTEITNYLKI